MASNVSCSPPCGPAPTETLPISAAPVPCCAVAPSGPVAPSIAVQSSVVVTDEGANMLYVYTPPIVDGFPFPTVTRTLMLDLIDVTASMVGNSYTIPKTASGARQLVMTYTAANTTLPNALSIVTSVVPAAVLPANTVLPVITGVLEFGQSLTSDVGTWTGTDPITYAYQWQRGVANIAGATASTYTLVQSDVGNTVRVGITASNVSGSVSVNSASTPTVTTIPSVIQLSDWSLADSPSVGGDQLALTISTLPFDGASPLTALQWRVGAGAPQTLSGLGVGQRIITVLANTLASVQVRGVNAIGNGPWSTARTATPTIGVEFVSQGAVTFNWTGLREVGTYFCGTPYAVIGAGITLTEPTPVATGSGAGRRNGTMLGPKLQGSSIFNSWTASNTGLGFDGRVTGAYLLSAEATFPLVASVNDFVMKGVSKVTVDNIRAGALDEVAVLHVASAPPASPTHIAPSPIGWPSRATFVSRQLNVNTVLNLIPQLDMTGMSVPDNLELYLASAEKYNASILVTLQDGTGGYENVGVFGGSDPTALALGQGNYGVVMAARNSALIAMLYMPNNHPLLPVDGKARAVKALGIRGSWRYDTSEGHADRPVRTNAGGHWNFGVSEMILGLAATGRIGTISSIATVRPENQLSLPFSWTAPLIARCAPHNSDADPYPWRIKTVSAISGLDVSVNRIANIDPFHYIITGMELRKVVGNTLIGTVTTTLTQNGASPMVFALSSVAGLAVSDETYFTWATAPTIGDTDWCIGGQTDFYLFNPQGVAEYRAFQPYVADVFLVRSLGQYGAWAEACEKYTVQSLRSDWPAGNDFGATVPDQYSSPIGTWWRQIYATHAATVGIAVDPPNINDPPVRGWYFDGVNDAVFSDSGISIPTSDRFWCALTAKFDANPASASIFLQAVTSGGFARFAVTAGSSGAVVLTVRNTANTIILSHTAPASTIPLGEWFTYAVSADLSLATPVFTKYLWKKSTGLWTVLGNAASPLLQGSLDAFTRARVLCAAGGGSRVEGNLSAILLRFGETIDLTDSAIRARLVPGFAPIGSQGGGVSGNAVDVFLAGDTFHVNKGTRGGLGLVGTLTAASDLPFP